MSKFLDQRHEQGLGSEIVQRAEGVWGDEFKATFEALTLSERVRLARHIQDHVDVGGQIAAQPKLFVQLGEFAYYDRLTQLQEEERHCLAHALG